MQFWCGFLLILQLINVLKCELSLEIIKYVNGNETIISDSITEIAGRNMTLVCNLVVPFNDSITYYDDKLSWGWKNKNFPFRNITDLENLAKNDPKQLYHFVDKSGTNRAVKRFFPLFPLESGTYFCMSLKYKLFKIVNLDVIIGKNEEDRVNYYKAMQDARANFKMGDPFILPKFLCSHNEFTCKSGGPCFAYEYACDNVKDCNDGSDEDVNLCGTDPCAGKQQCSSGRCISESSCCDKVADPECPVFIKHSCCFEYHDTNHRWASSPRSKNYDFTNDFTDNVHWNNYEVERPKFKHIWISTVCILILIILIISIIVRHLLKLRSKKAKSNNEDNLDVAESHHDALTELPPTVLLRPSNPEHISQSGMYLDNPPSYDEVMLVSPSEKINA